MIKQTTLKILAAAIATLTSLSSFAKSVTFNYQNQTGDIDRREISLNDVPDTLHGLRDALNNCFGDERFQLEYDQAIQVNVECEGENSNVDFTDFDSSVIDVPYILLAAMRNGVTEE